MVTLGLSVTFCVSVLKKEGNLLVNSFASDVSEEDSEVIQSWQCFAEWAQKNVKNVKACWFFVWFTGKQLVQNAVT